MTGITTIKKSIRPDIFWGIAVTLAIGCMAIIYRNTEIQCLNWTFPYFSGAANIQTLGDWNISPSDFNRVLKMSVSEYLAYHHQTTNDTIPNIANGNNYGFLLVVYIARLLFPWMGDGNAVVLLQLIVHVITTLVILYSLPSLLQKVTFFTLYGINPLVLHFVTYPFYYYWTVLPSFILVILWMYRGKIGLWLIPIGLMLYVGYLIRQMTLMVCFLSFAVSFWKNKIVYAILGVSVFILLLINSPFESNGAFWHTAYVGIGAYENQYGIELTDESAFGNFTKNTGMPISANAIDGTYQNRKERTIYWNWLKDQYLAAFKESPVLFARNAVYNTVQAFGFGFDVKRYWVNYIGGFVGLCLLGLIIWTKQWVWGIGILAYSMTFTPYYPPIPAYIFGAYIFKALIAARVIELVILSFSGRIEIRKHLGLKPGPATT